MLNGLVFQKHLEEGETILYVVHRHAVVVLAAALQWLIFGMTVPAMLYLSVFPTRTFLLLAVAWFLIFSVRFFYQLINWYADAWLLTSAGILSVEWHGFFRNAATRLGYEDLEGVGYEIQGFWSTILQYGQMTLKVASGNHVVMEQVKSPKKVELEIARCQELYMNEQSSRGAAKMQELLSQMIAHHLRQPPSL